jgi:CheY-like chemotaxis protein
MHIEDNDDHAELVASVISQCKMTCDVMRLSDAETASKYLLDATQSDHSRSLKLPDLILLDLSLPGISGLEFLEQLRGDQLTSPVPVIVLTTSDREDEIQSAYRKGANSYIVKPAKYDDFVIKLTEMNMYWGETAEVPDPALLAR